ncbi:MAG TPA: plastocyanin [Leptospiraceae bacterium]|nr:plastocyanin [Spirochaetaceae bacterium]HBS06125.1 plastocyanin [Leptospiraceae bacterium]|tara:strand:+ start:51541 stop:53541 length:2001 start_codon:yes stop_codon:yes gene_type:complete
MRNKKENAILSNEKTRTDSSRGLLRWLGLSAGALLIGSLAALCGDSSNLGYVHVDMIDNSFSPPLQRIHKGGTIVFKNIGRNPHNAVAVDDAWSTENDFGSLNMMGGDKASVTYPEEGVFPYYCTFHATPDQRVGMVGTIVVGNVEYNPQTAKKAEPVSEWTGVTRRVPSDYPTIQTAVDAADPGDMVLIAPGVYKEEVVITTPSLIIRGEDRNKVIVDGEHVRGNAVTVVGADGVAIENMTARNAVLNGFFWTSVKGYRGSHLTAYNNGDYGIYAFDSQDGVIKHSYASGSPDSSFYIGQCYPCKAIIHDIVAEYSALGYSGTNAGGELYLINSIWKNNIVGLAPNTLDSELLPPQREATIWGNIVLNNNNIEAPFVALTWPSFGNGILVAGGLRNHIEKNIIINHPNNGIVMLPNLQENFWLSHGTVVKDNYIAGSGRTDISLSGPISMGNCFSGNSYSTTIPFGLEHFSGCDSPIRYMMGGDMSMMMGAMAMMMDAKMGNFKSGDYKTQPIPEAQPEMPEDMKASIKPALTPFEDHSYLIEKAAFHPDAQKYLAEAKGGPSYVGSVQTVVPGGFLAIVYHIFAYLLPFVVYASWTFMAFLDMHQKKENNLGWTAGIILVPFLGSLAYHLKGGSTLPGWLRKSMLISGGGVFLLVVLVAVALIF